MSCAEGNSGRSRNVKREKPALETRVIHHGSADSSRMDKQRRGENVVGDRRDRG